MERLGGDVEWRALTLSDVPLLARFAPPEWRMALDAVVLQHIGRDYFVGCVATDQSGIVAVGHGIATGPSGWLGNIIVRPDMRRRGLGSRVTEQVIAGLRQLGCSSLILIATELGEPVYRALGFRTTAQYVFFDMPRLPPVETAAIRRLKPRDVGRTLDLDARATGEVRTMLLAPHLAHGWGYVSADDTVQGYFLPTLGAGLVIADTAAAGCELLGFRLAFYPGSPVVPAANRVALAFLERRGARETVRLPRMVLGEEPPWQPDLVYARGAGYCG